jgi:transposase
MPRVIRVRLTEEQWTEWERRWRQRSLAPRVRERLEMIRRSDLGWSPPRIAAAMGVHEQTVRKYVKAFLTGGFDALADRPRTGRPPTVTRTDLDALAVLLDESAAVGRTWTLPQAAQWLTTERGVTVSTGRLSVLLKQRRFRWKRTKRSVRHKRKDPDRQRQAEVDLASLHRCSGRQPQA